MPIAGNANAGSICLNNDAPFPSYNERIKIYVKYIAVMVEGQLVNV
jgi:hypothetical protein